MILVDWTYVTLFIKNLTNNTMTREEQIILEIIHRINRAYALGQEQRVLDLDGEKDLIKAFLDNYTQHLREGLIKSMKDEYQRLDDEAWEREDDVRNFGFQDAIEFVINHNKTPKP